MRPAIVDGLLIVRVTHGWRERHFEFCAQVRIRRDFRIHVVPCEVISAVYWEPPPL
jgi:hypothetical protein